MSDLQGLVPVIEAAAEAAIQRSVIQTIVPIYRQATVVEVDTVNWIHRVQMDGDVDTIQVHDETAGGAFTGARVVVMFAPPHQGKIIAVSRRHINWKTWDVEWTSAGSQPSIGDGNLTGSYQRRGQSVDLNLWCLFGASTSGGTLGWFFSLPVPAAIDVGEQVLTVKGFTTGGGNWVGFAYMTAGGTIMTPYLPFNSGVSFLGQVQNADGTGAAGTGIPLIGGQYSFTNGSNMVITGSYKAQS